MEHTHAYWRLGKNYIKSRFALSLGCAKVFSSSALPSTSPLCRVVHDVINTCSRSHKPAKRGVLRMVEQVTEDENAKR